MQNYKKNVMKLNIFGKIAILALICMSAIGFQSCSDDIDGCGLTVVVADAQGNRIDGAAVIVGVDRNGEIAGGGNTIRKEAVSDKNGEAYFFFDNEAIFTIFASITADDGYTVRTGKSTVQLKYGKMITKEVLLP